ncbi:DUF3040 domain-containing protein [Nocardioides sp.]|uniref:DUF3040 domain-containing protein n=1 Tax=Nocardioides sp. TaxID=35761 RepID=UPI002736F2FE|nr:DUF3040 domain-containing protein [Nocardioides sp.]MDP3889707.1 DUF3040 domain-containing protein [Nocardioides sp.]
MPLSEEELRMLEQMERALVEEDPKFASTLRGTSLRRNARRRAVLAGLVFLVGIVALMTGAVMSIPVVGIIGFVIMLGAAMVAVTSFRAPGQAPAAQKDTALEGFGVIDGGRSGRGRSHGRRTPHDTSFMNRMEERWRRRRENGY